MDANRHQQLLETLQRFPRTDLDTIGQDHLLNRHDVKYVLPVEEVCIFLKLLSQDWQVLDIASDVIHAYENLYFDTSNFQCYLDHHNEKRSRYKFRLRTYQNTQETFLEVKEKTNKDKTLKTRLPRASSDPRLTKVEQAWLRQLQTRLNPALLVPQLQTHYQRVSFIHRNGDRLTIDQDLSFKTADHKQAFMLPHLAIVELKKGQKTGPRAGLTAFRQMGISALPISKYCLGIMLTHPSIKFNRFKEKWRRVKGFQSFLERSQS